MQMIANGRDYMPRISRYGLAASLGTLGDRLTFSIPTDPTDPDPPEIELGAAVRLSGDAKSLVYFDGIITARRHTDTAREYTAYDFCYYLNKSQICIQFPEQRTDRAIAQLWAALGIKYTRLPAMQGVLEAITYIKTPSAILGTLLDFERDISGVEYFPAADGYGTINILPVGYLRSGLTLSGISSPVMADSLDEMRNRIYYAIKSDDIVTLTAEAADEASIARYGQIAEYIVDSAEPIYTAAVADRRLARKRVPLPTGELTALGDWSASVGSVIAADDAVTGLRGDFIIDAVTHDVNDGLHLMTLGLSQRGGAA